LAEDLVHGHRAVLRCGTGDSTVLPAVCLWLLCRPLCLLALLLLLLPPLLLLSWTLLLLLLRMWLLLLPLLRLWLLPLALLRLWLLLLLLTRLLLGLHAGVRCCCCCCCRLCCKLPLSKHNQPPVQNTGVQFVEHTEQGDATVIGGITEVTLLWQVDDGTGNLVNLFQIPHQ
jgi:hypothetical protein